jgi:uncharacterized protein (DUF2141 family)
VSRLLRWRSQCVIAAWALAFVVSQAAAAASVTIDVSNVRSPMGHIRFAICSRATFLHDSCEFEAKTPAVVGKTTIVFPDIPPGRYAVQIFQDEYDDGIVHRGMLGIPTEGIGFSNDAPLHLHGPRFNDAAFDVGDRAVGLRIRVRSLMP